MEALIDSMKECCIEGCKNLAEVCNIENGVRFRRKYCSKHKREAYGMKRKARKHDEVKKYRMNGKKDKCLLCGWIGPCDAHRMDWGSYYNLDNMSSLCPNCHRLIHRGLLKITDEQRERIVAFNKEMKQLFASKKPGLPYVDI